MEENIATAYQIQLRCFLEMVISPPGLALKLLSQQIIYMMIPDATRFRFIQMDNYIQSLILISFRIHPSHLFPPVIQLRMVDLHSNMRSLIPCKPGITI